MHEETTAAVFVKLFAAAWLTFIAVAGVVLNVYWPTAEPTIAVEQSK